MQRTFAMIKPDAVRNAHSGEIIAQIQKSGIYIDALRMVILTETLAREFYAVHNHRPFFESLVDFMTSGPSVLMVLRAEDVIVRYRELMGATDPHKSAEGTIRARFGSNVEQNAVHGSDSAKTAATEIDFFRRALSLWC